MPGFGFTPVGDRPVAQTDGLDNPIPAQQIRQTDAATGLAFSAPGPVDAGSLTLTGEVQGIRTNSSAALARTATRPTASVSTSDRHAEPVAATDKHRSALLRMWLWNGLGEIAIRAD